MEKIQNIKNLKMILDRNFNCINGIYISKNYTGYWSNLPKAEQSKFIDIVKEASPLNLEKEIKNKYPRYFNYIFNNDRTKGLDLLNIQSNEIGADFGCMWGNILMFAAKRCTLVVGFDKTIEHLLFIRERMKKEKINNVILVNKNLQENFEIKEIFDFAIVNGVLEWIPVTEDIELDNIQKNQTSNLNITSPADMQLGFLANVSNSLKPGGRLYLAIENRWDYQYFLWKKDPHTSLFYTAFLPRKLSNIISQMFRRKPYVNYLYSIKSIEKILKKAGFSEITAYGVFPNYRYPKVIVPVHSKSRIDLENIYKPLNSKNFLKIYFHRIRRFLDFIIYEKFKLFSLSPSFIIIAKK